MLRLLLLVLACAALGLTSASPSKARLSRHFQEQLEQPTTQCGIDNYDFSKLTSTADWVGLDQHYDEIYYLNICNKGVQNLWCTLNSNTASSQICQVNPGDTSVTYSIANNDQSAMKWSYINGKDASQGVQMMSPTGDKCPNGSPRVGIAQFVCGNSTGVITAINEAPQCTYTLTVPTELVCSNDSERFETNPELIKRVDKIRANKKIHA